MFGKNKNLIQPKSLDDSILIELSGVKKINKKTKVTVPPQYKAIAYVDQKALFRIEPCIEKEILSTYGKEYKDKYFRVAFISSRTFAQSAWGFGNIQVNNEALKEAYRIGANGKFSIEITDYAKLIAAFPNCDVITLEQIREKSISTLKTVGTPILSEYFSKTNTSIFEMSSLIADFRNKFFDALSKENIFDGIGIKISSITVDGFHANEEDLELIRTRINA